MSSVASPGQDITEKGISQNYTLLLNVIEGAMVIISHFWSLTKLFLLYFQGHRCL